MSRHGCSEYQRYNFESNSQPQSPCKLNLDSCSEYQRYNFLKAIQNNQAIVARLNGVVQNIKDTIFWKQFTTFKRFYFHFDLLFRISKIQFFESNSQLNGLYRVNSKVVQNIKDTIFWKQFTTPFTHKIISWQLFRISKIQFFESNSQLTGTIGRTQDGCSEYQRYNFLKAIHNISAFNPFYF